MQLKIGNEISFCCWLCNYIIETLQKTYIVEIQKENLIKIYPNLVLTELNKNAAFKEDLMIQKGKLFNKETKCLLVFTKNNDLPFWLK